MSKSTKQKFARQCGTKQRHSETEAFKHLADLRRKDGAFWMQVYKCEVCKQFHVGHKPRNRGGHR